MTPVLSLDGVSHTLSVYGVANSVFASGTNVYVAGQVHTNSIGDNYDPMYWLDGVVKTLPSVSGFLNNESKDIFVANGDVHVVGNGGATYHDIPDKAIYWKNGDPLVLPEPDPDTIQSKASAKSIFVNGSDVYIVGTQKGNYGTNAICWSNGIPTILSGTPGFPFVEATDVAVSGADVYVSGNQQPGSPGGVPIYYYNGLVWKNGVPQLLSSIEANSRAATTAIFISGNDVYISGFQVSYNGVSTTFKALYWKNGVPVALPPLATGTNYGASSIFVVGNDIHIVGWVDDDSITFSTKGVYWKNGVVSELKGFSQVNSIFVRN